MKVHLFKGQNPQTGDRAACGFIADFGTSANSYVDNPPKPEDITGKCEKCSDLYWKWGSELIW